MKCINEAHDHTETINGKVVDMTCSDCGERCHYDEGVKDYVHDNQEHNCWLHSVCYATSSRSFVLRTGYVSPCMFDVTAVLASVLPEFNQNVDWSCATAQETSDLLNNLRDGFSEFWGVRV